MHYSKSSPKNQLPKISRRKSLSKWISFSRRRTTASSWWDGSSADRLSSRTLRKPWWPIWPWAISAVFWRDYVACPLYSKWQSLVSCNRFLVMINLTKPFKLESTALPPCQTLRVKKMPGIRFRTPSKPKCPRKKWNKLSLDSCPKVISLSWRRNTRMPSSLPCTTITRQAPTTSSKPTSKPWCHAEAKSAKHSSTNSEHTFQPRSHRNNKWASKAARNKSRHRVPEPGRPRTTRPSTNWWKRPSSLLRDKRRSEILRRRRSYENDSKKNKGFANVIKIGWLICDHDVIF